MASTILADVKKALRINHSQLDSELNANISEAKAEMVRIGIAEDIASDETNYLIVAAIKTYCKMINASDIKTQEAFEKSWIYQIDNLRKSTLVAPVQPEGGDD